MMVYSAAFARINATDWSIVTCYGLAFFLREEIFQEVLEHEFQRSSSRDYQRHYLDVVRVAVRVFRGSCDS